jgi:hypothetical protein
MPDKKQDDDRRHASETDSAERFKAVVKRLLDTPPMHKAAKPKPKRKKARKE